MNLRQVWLRALVVSAGLLSAGAGLAQSRGAPVAPCRPLAFEGAGYMVCTVDLRRERVEMFRARADGQPYASLGNLADAPEGRGLLFAMNGGMYQADLSPVGLYVEKGREVKRANTAAGPGNFHLKPNGVLYVTEGRAGVVETGRYLRERPRAVFATQSGPMLVIDGRIHPKISEEGPSQKRRNGVGLRDPNTLVFAISDQPVSFGAFARLFKNELGCANALFLDGSVSSLYAPSAGRRDSFFPVGPIVAAFPK